MMKILLISAYDAASHRSWREQLVAMLPDFYWQVLSLPARHFNWRIRGNSLSLAFEQAETLRQDYDLLLVTDMVDLNGLRGFVPELASLPTVVYFHENQFAYPLQTENYLEPKIVNLYSALSADHIVFNSHYNRDSFITGVDTLLQKMPDHVPPGLTEKIENNSEIIPVPIAEKFFTGNTRSVERGKPVLLWNHRWEYDKAPQRLYLALTELKQQGVAFKVNIIGPRFRRQPEIFAKLESDFQQEIINFGYLELAEDYLKVLQQSDIVLSTALHDFQGLALIEAIATGCIPLVPDRLNYPEYIPAANRYPSYMDNETKEARAMAQHISHTIARLQQNDMEPVDISRFSPNKLKNEYRNLFESMMR